MGPKIRSGWDWVTGEDPSGSGGLWGKLTVTIEYNFVDYRKLKVFPERTAMRQFLK